MHGLRQRVLRFWRRPDSEHGAAASLLAVLLSGGVLLGMGALVIDVGRLYVEREELQTGADAGSWKIALNCIRISATKTTPKTCTTTDPSVAAAASLYATKNVKDPAPSATAQACVNLDLAKTTVASVTCPAWNTPVACPPLPTPPAGQSNGRWVEVRTSTLTKKADGSTSTLFPPTFAGTLTGGPTKYTGKTVGACARVNWGPPVVEKVFALGISKCDWERMTSNGTVYYNALGGLLNQIGLFNIIGLPNPTAGKDGAIAQVLPAVLLGLPLPSCTTPVNLTRPRGYTWLFQPNAAAPLGYQAPDANCEITLRVGDAPRGFLLSNLLQQCFDRLAAARASGKPVLVPIFDIIEQELLSLAPAYRIAGFAPFVVTGYKDLLGGLGGGLGSLLSGGGLAPLLEGTLCGLSGCIYGYFTRTLVPHARPQFGTVDQDFGATVIGRTG